MHVHTCWSHDYSHLPDADIHSITPQVGSVKGGTVITITGTGFRVDAEEDIAVDINGISCRV